MNDSRKTHFSTITSSIYESLIRNSNGVLGGRFLLAVSGGADSLALLYAMKEIQAVYACELFVITVDHNLREDSASDAEFVKRHCNALGIACSVCRLAEGLVEERARMRKKGVEEAARFLRLHAFEAEAEKRGVDAILTAHTRNDLLETRIMRFFQGASLESLEGIAECRGLYLRPMLRVDRRDVVQFLKDKGLAWREDSTNAETRWLRNRVRHILIPALEECFANPYSGAEKTLRLLGLDAALVADYYEQAKNTEPKCVWSMVGNAEADATSLRCDGAAFLSLPLALKLRFLKEGLTALSVQKRVPLEILEALANISIEKASICSGGLCFVLNDGELVLSLEDRRTASADESGGYLLFVEECGRYSLPFGACTVYKHEDGGIFVKAESDLSEGIGAFSFPFYIRSRFPGDRLGGKNGVMIKKILNDAQLPLVEREIIPIIEERGRISAVYGKVCGIKNYCVSSSAGD